VQFGAVRQIVTSGHGAYVCCYWLRVSDVAGLVSATDQAKTQELPGRGDDFEPELGILSFGGRTELRDDLRRHNSAPNTCFRLAEVA
jgi:hypothetical protein